jgi:nicotinate phosphoribosyltransferase
MEGPLATDLYQITMAYAYWKSGKANEEAVFHLHYRQNPFQGGYSIACGLEPAIDWLLTQKFEPADVTYLATLTGDDRRTPLFEPAFLDYLLGIKLDLDVDAAEEGSVVFAHEPLVRVRGPILQAQLVETALLCIINFQTLVATKSARLCQAAEGQPVIEFGLRRAQGFDGALAASRAAYIGGCTATSNVYAGRKYGIEVRGTHAHSWVMSFDSEKEAFATYTRAMPNNLTYLVDTYSTLQGVRNAVDVAKAAGAQIAGIRLDSGDLAWLSGEARKILDAAGFPNARVFATNDLDEYVISSIRRPPGNGVACGGGGTRRVTSFDPPARGGVYKLAAIRRTPGAEWEPRVKLSETAIKVSNPGIQNVRRFVYRGEAVGDIIFDELFPIPEGQDWVMVDPADQTRRKKFTESQPIPPTAQLPDAAAAAAAEPTPVARTSRAPSMGSTQTFAAGSLTHYDLLTPIVRKGKLIRPHPPLSAVRARAQAQLAQFHPGIKRFENPHEYPVGLERAMYERKTALIFKLREMHQSTVKDA